METITMYMEKNHQMPDSELRSVLAVKRSDWERVLHPVQVIAPQSLDLGPSTAPDTRN